MCEIGLDVCVYNNVLHFSKLMRFKFFFKGNKYKEKK